MGENDDAELPVDGQPASHAGAGIGSPRGFLDLPSLRRRAEEEVERALRYKRPLAVVVLSLGGEAHPALEPRVCAALRLPDLGGWASRSQILIVLPETAVDAAKTVARRILETALRLEGRPPESSSTRSGFAVFPADGYDIDTLLASASAAAQHALTREGPPSSVYRSFDINKRVVVVADPAMARMYALLARLAASDLTVLVRGETGAGKELAATALHAWSPRRARPFLALNCAAIQEQLVESELFGHEKGAYSGATTSKAGLFEAASGGTVFLDEVGELSLVVQAKLLRALETKRVMRIGDVREREVDIRIVAATNRDLARDVEEGRFRHDLYFRFGDAILWLPPLRDRLVELPILARRLLAEACEHEGRPPMDLSLAAVNVLSGYGWPGNVRELKNVMDYLAATLEGTLVDAEHLPARLSEVRASVRARAPAPPVAASVAPPSAFRPIDEEVRELERTRMLQALAVSGGNRTRAAALISMPLRTFLTKMKVYDLALELRRAP